MKKNINQTEKDIFNNLLTDIVKEIKRNNRRINNLMSKTVFGSPKILSGIILSRMNHSFSAINKLLKGGYDFEAVTICRSVLEQLALSFKICSMDDIEAINKLNATKCITDLKKFFPMAGDLYGVLSNIAHFHPDVVKSLINYKDDKVNKIDFYDKNHPGIRSLCILYLTLLVDCYGSVIEYLFIDKIKIHRYFEIDKTKNIFYLKHMPLTDNIDEYADKIHSLDKNDFEVYNIPFKMI